MAGLQMEEGRSGRVSRLSYIKPRPTPQLVRARKLRMASLSAISHGDLNLRSVAKCNCFLRCANGCLWHGIGCGAGARAVPHLPRSTKGTEKKNANASMPIATRVSQEEAVNHTERAFQSFESLTHIQFESFPTSSWFPNPTWARCINRRLSTCVPDPTQSQQSQASL